MLKLNIKQRAADASSSDNDQLQFENFRKGRNYRNVIDLSSQHHANHNHHQKHLQGIDERKSAREMHKSCHKHQVRQRIAKLNRPLMQKMSPLEIQLIYAKHIRKSQ